MDTEYFPILKGKQGELRAIAEMRDATLTTPVIEVVPWEREGTLEDETAEIAKSADRIAKAWGLRDQLVYVDCALAEQDPFEGWTSLDGWTGEPPRPVLAALLTSLRTMGIRSAPVVRAASAAVEGYLDAVVAAFEGEAFRAERVLIRITAEDLDETTAPLRDVAALIARILGVEHDRVDIMIDFGALTDDAILSMSSRLGRYVVPQFQDQGWRSVAVGGGAFPPDLSEVTPGTIARLPRREVRLWQTLNSYLSSSVGYADYAVTHPVLPQGVPFAAPPQLRFATGTDWLVSKGRRNDRRGHQQFYDICAAILDASGESEPGTSWGDEQVALAASSATADKPLVGPGNASTWRAIATSRHLGQVERRLHEGGEP